MPLAADLHSRRLVARAPAPGDGATLRALLRDPAVAAWIAPDGRPFAEDRVAAIFALFRRHWLENGLGPRLLFRRGDLAPVGYCGLCRDGPEARTAELLYTLAPAFQGRGLAREAAEAILAEGTARLGSGTQWRILTRTDNLPSRALAERLGFSEHSRLDKMGLPHVVYIFHSP